MNNTFLNIVTIDNDDQLHASPKNNNTNGNIYFGKEKNTENDVNNNTENNINDKDQFKTNKIADLFKVPKLEYKGKPLDFNFKNSNWFLTINYIVLFISIPIIYSIVITAIGTNKKTDGLDILFFMFFPFLSFIIAIATNWKVMFKKNGYLAYFHWLTMILAGILAAFILKRPADSDSEHDKNIYSALTFWVQIIVQLIAIVIVIATNKTIRVKLVQTLKKSWQNLLVVVLIIFIIAMAFNRLLSLFPSSNYQISVGGKMRTMSDNQKGLESLTKTKIGLIAFIIGPIFIAPLIEEFGYREGAFSIIRGKWIAFIASAIYFPSMHVMENFDWKSFTGYFSLGLLLPLIFVSSRGNIWYSITLHATWNTISTISYFVSQK